MTTEHRNLLNTAEAYLAAEELTERFRKKWVLHKSQKDLETCCQHLKTAEQLRNELKGLIKVQRTPQLQKATS